MTNGVIWPKLFSRRSDGKVQVWWAEINDDQYRFSSGINEGEIVTSEWTTANPKNVGKKNGTDGASQAIAEVKSQYKKKRDKGYKDNIKDVDNIEFFECMLAKDYNDYEIEFPVWTQPKLDGCRCIVNKDGMFYRSGKPIISAPHVFEELKPMFAKYPNLILDGELYTHKLRDDFNKLISLAKKTKPTKEDLDESKKHLQYHIYDCYVGQTEKFSQRWSFIQSLFTEFGVPYNGILHLVFTNSVLSQESLDKFYGLWVQDGYEGQMVRIDEVYENKRSKFLLKRKEFKDAEFKILDIEEGKGNRSGVAGRCIFEIYHKGVRKEFSANIIGGMTLYEDMLRNKHKYIGKEVTVKYFNLTPDGVPRFPVVSKFDK